MSTVKVNTLTGVSTAGSIAVTGEGGSTTTNLQNGLAKAYATVNAYQTTTGTTSSFNISSTTDDGTGLWDNAYTNNMSADLYSVAQIGTAGQDSDTHTRMLHVRTTVHTDSNPASMLTSGCGFAMRWNTASAAGTYGYAFSSFLIFGDLA